MKTSWWRHGRMLAEMTSLRQHTTISTKPFFAAFRFIDVLTGKTVFTERLYGYPSDLSKPSISSIDTSSFNEGQIVGMELIALALALAKAILPPLTRRCRLWMYMRHHLSKPIEARDYPSELEMASLAGFRLEQSILKRA
jgi:hypothetical protein